MADPTTTRWSQIVRSPGQARVLGHHATAVEALGSDAGPAAARPGIRVLTAPVAGEMPRYMLDITSSAALAMLEGFLGTGAIVGKNLSWRAAGFGSRRRDTIRIRPA